MLGFLKRKKKLPEFPSPAQIVEDFYNGMNKEQRYNAAAIAEEDIIQYHHTTGRGIRNNYKLWNPDNPHVNHEDVNAWNHPDQLSYSIMKDVIKRCKNG